MMQDKNGTEIKLGDTVHYYRRAHERELDNGRVIKTKERNITFVINEFVNNPILRHNASGFSRGITDKRWITGSELITGGSQNSVSPRAVVKVSTMVKKDIGKLVFIKPVKKLHVTDSGLEAQMGFIPGTATVSGGEQSRYFDGGGLHPTPPPLRGRIRPPLPTLREQALSQERWNLELMEAGHKPKLTIRQKIRKFLGI